MSGTLDLEAGLHWSSASLVSPSMGAITDTLVARRDRAGPEASFDENLLLNGSEDDIIIASYYLMNNTE
ncbi:hypothetical protein M3650_12120 [Paenibacillus sp. MER TA 81-3]|uniref:hypothetical protein n=1 Tax=Paenibacillus sp. MER TA 81-3 TaxID=2939573 RepID=UPI00203B95F4|nr:hypothetical protein [Paenibacillus sp. MER TA 81-3]MCM3339362.1 hypothetical protein [Paenibacillus sp. MER TA 81-3]